nr:MULTISPECIES: cupin domain-containing protein [unclassified Streptomyces]
MRRQAVGLLEAADQVGGVGVQDGGRLLDTHEDTDELITVVSGRLTLQLRDGEVVLGPGELFVVPRGVEHCPVAEEVTAILLLEPAGTLNTGDVGGPRTKAPEALA